jgi:hypothetical protein
VDRQRAEVARERAQHNNLSPQRREGAKVSRRKSKDIAMISALVFLFFCGRLPSVADFELSSIGYRKSVKAPSRITFPLFSPGFTLRTLCAFAPLR